MSIWELSEEFLNKVGPERYTTIEVYKIPHQGYFQ